MVIRVGAVLADLATGIDAFRALKTPEKARDRMDAALDQVT